MAAPQTSAITMVNVPGGFDASVTVNTLTGVGVVIKQFLSRQRLFDLHSQYPELDPWTCPLLVYRVVMEIRRAGITKAQLATGAQDALIISTMAALAVEVV